MCDRCALTDTTGCGSFLALVVLMLLAAASSAQASVNWVVRGHGFGHGVGVSQYGAYGYALHGKDYRFILGHYYQGRTISQMEGARIVRVLLDISPRRYRLQRRHQRLWPGPGPRR